MAKLYPLLISRVCMTIKLPLDARTVRSCVKQSRILLSSVLLFNRPLKNPASRPILPFFVASGLHVTRDIPVKHFGLPRNATDGTVEIEGKQIKITIDQPFGEDPNLTDILQERIEELRTPGKDTRVIVMGHGSRLDYNSQVVELNAKRLEERGYGKVYFGYNEFNDPKIEDVIPQMIDDGAEEIIALPLFISLGKHLTMDVPGKLGIEDFSDSGIVHRNGRDVELKYAIPVGADPRLCDVLVEKLRKYE